MKVVRYLIKVIFATIFFIVGITIMTTSIYMLGSILGIV